GQLMAIETGTLLLKVGSASEALLLGVALAMRIKRMREDKERAQAALLEERTAQARLLERRVEERTRALEQTLVQLRDTQAQVVRQARLASLGNLVAGVAPEVGNPLNFRTG